MDAVEGEDDDHQLRLHFPLSFGNLPKKDNGAGLQKVLEQTRRVAERSNSHWARGALPLTLPADAARHASRALGCRREAAADELAVGPQRPPPGAGGGSGSDDEDDEDGGAGGAGSGEEHDDAARDPYNLPVTHEVVLKGACDCHSFHTLLQRRSPPSRCSQATASLCLLSTWSTPAAA